LLDRSRVDHEIALIYIQAPAVIEDTVTVYIKPERLRERREWVGRECQDAICLSERQSIACPDRLQLRWAAGEEALAENELEP